MTPFSPPGRATAALLTLLMSAGIAHASLVPLSTEDLARSAPLVVRGTVEETRSRFTPDGSLIVTFSAVRVEETYRGSHPRRRLVVETEGGEVGDVGLVVTDAAVLKEGDRVVLFLAPGRSATGRSVYRVVGEAQGAYRVGDDGVARKDGFHVEGDPSIVDFEIPLADLARRAREAR